MVKSKVKINGQFWNVVDVGFDIQQAAAEVAQELRSGTKKFKYRVYLAERGDWWVLERKKG